MAQYYTLDEAAQKLGLSVDAFRKKLATEWKSTPRRYPDGATLRFQVREIDELARSLNQSSEGDIPLSLADSSDDFIPVAGDDDVLGVERKSAKPSSSGKLPKTPSDSDVRLDAAGGLRSPKPKSGRRPEPTEVVDLDAERKPGKSSPRPTGKYDVTSDPDVAIKPPDKPAEGSEFELSLGPDSSDEFELQVGDDDSDEVQIGAMPRTLKPGDSGINLQAPADSGISLEKDSSSSEFELQIDDGGSKKSKKPSTDKLPPAAQTTAEDSSSEFELSLDDSGEKAAATDATTAYEAEDQKDIFETDFELPALDDESGSEAVALESDTDLESSDFDLALGEGDAPAEEASDSEVVAIDEDDAAVVEEDLDELEAAEDVELEAEEEEVRPARAAEPTAWGPLVTVPMFLTAGVMVLVGLMGFELLRGMWGYEQPYKPTGGLVRFFAETFGDKLPTD
jgi:hypothetical protein